MTLANRGIRKLVNLRQLTRSSLSLSPSFCFQHSSSVSGLSQVVSTKSNDPINDSKRECFMFKIPRYCLSKRDSTVCNRPFVELLSQSIAP